MLLQLNIENVAVFEKASIDFEKGLNVITGETGAGKSLLINSLNLVLGCRGAHGLIRSGADCATVSAVFFDKEADKEINALGIECDDGNIIITRRLYSDGRNLCKINGCTVPVATLRTFGQRLIVIHGQRDSGELLNTSSHLSFIDSFAREDKLLESYKSCYRMYKEAALRLSGMRSNEAERAREIDFLEFQVNEITQSELRPDEEEELLSRKNMLDNAETLCSLSHELSELLSGDGSIKDKLYSALRSSEQLSSIDASKASQTAQLTDMYYEIEEIARDMSGYASSVDFDPNMLKEIDDRLDLINTLKRKYGGNLQDVIEFCEKSSARLSELLSYDENRSALEDDVRSLKLQAEKIGEKLSLGRKKAAKILAAKITDELESLDMPSSRVEFCFTPCGLSENGIESAEMLLSTNPKAEPAPIGKIASGGEMSRIMLAIKSIFCDFDSTPTLLFDEIDTGVSGRAAEKIAVKMRALANTYQLICVTHLPIIASAGTNHILIEKHAEGGGITTYIKPLSPDERVGEIARMISGDNITDVSLANSRQMLLTYNTK